MLLKARAEDEKVDVDNIVRMNTDALALLGHISYEISQEKGKAVQFIPHCTKIIPHCVLHTCLLQIFCLVININRSSTTFGLQARSVARQAYQTPRKSETMENPTHPVITSLGSLF